MEFGLSLGANLGDCLENLKQAKAKIASTPRLRLAGLSRVYETVPVDVAPEFMQHYFLNAVVIVESSLSPKNLSARLHIVEAEMGRTRNTQRNAPRPIDIDIIYAGNVRIDTTALTIPHPRWARRRFVVQPLADVRPDLKLPGENRSVIQVLLSLPEPPEVVLYSTDW